MVLYIGQAVNIRNRMVNHLDDPDKIRETLKGRAIFFYWFEFDNIGQLERTWLNIHVQHEGRCPNPQQGLLSGFNLNLVGSIYTQIRTRTDAAPASSRGASNPRSNVSTRRSRSVVTVVLAIHRC